LRERLMKTAASELEKLLVDRVVISWIEVYHGDIDLANQLLHVSGASKTAQAAQGRLDRAHARYLTAIKALATTHKLLRPALSPLGLAVKFVLEEKASAAGLRPSRCGFRRFILRHLLSDLTHAARTKKTLKRSGSVPPDAASETFRRSEETASET
jgi:hypothetical protein